MSRCFFFSSRRRHTIFDCDWSSDVCSSDLSSYRSRKAPWTVARIHPDQDESTVQGALRLLYELQGILAKIAGMDAVTLQPAAGAQGEHTGLLLAQAYHRDRGEERHQVILPDTAHGTNFASAGMLGVDVVEIPSKDGRVDLKALESAASDQTLAFMLTNP